MNYARPNVAPVPFKIRATKRIVFRDQRGTEVKVFEIGDEITATHASESGYWVTSMGGIYFEEAELV